MIADLNETSSAEPLAYDVCIVGSGPAGMTVACELRDAGLRICVLESGKRRTSRHGDRLRRVLSEGIPIKEYSRERVLGGASTTWAGLSSPLDEVDLRPRPFLRHSGWPISREELLPFYGEAAERYRFPPLSFFGPEGFGAIREEGDVQPTWDRIDEKVFLACSQPQNFGREFCGVFEEPGIDLYLDATLLCLEGAPGGGRIDTGRVRSSGGNELRVRAAIWVVATGGIENARLLLNSRDLCPRGLGNERDQVGRYMMNHPKNYYGILRLDQPVTELPYYFGCLYQDYAGYSGLRLRQDLQAERGLLNSYVRFEPLFPWSDNPGVEALVFFVKHSQFVFTRWKARKQGKLISLRDYSETGDDSDLQNERKSALELVALLGKVIANLPRVSQYLYFRLIERARPRIRRVRLRNFMEMEPDPENRVVLSEELDDYGQPLPLVRHRCTELDRRSLIALHEVLVEELPRAGLGQLVTRLHEEESWPITQDASHHMGTTRMGRDPATSVVDPDCRLHGVENVYLAGASVFPTSGCANPTFTLVALAIRLARHLRRDVFGHEPSSA